MIYPFDIESAPLLRHPKLLNEYDQIIPVSPRGWGYCGKDASICDNGYEIGSKVYEDFDDCLNITNTVMFVKSDKILDFNQYIYPKIQQAIHNKKNIILGLSVSEEVIKEIAQNCEEHGVNYTDLLQHSKYSTIDHDNNLYEIETPVVFVLGIDEYTNKFEIQISLKEELIKSGYKVSQIGTKQYSNIVGMHAFPSVMFEKELEANKIIFFNNYVKQIETNENPDIIIIGIPSGIASYNGLFNNNFGIICYEVAQAVKPDYVIVTGNYVNMNLDYVKEIGSLVSNKFNFDIDFINISNSHIDYISSEQMGYKVYINVSMSLLDDVVKRYRDNGLPTVNILNPSDRNIVYEDLISNLSSNSDTFYI
jgi:peptide maturation system protein (TIGR04066 family)